MNWFVALSDPLFGSTRRYCAVTLKFCAETYQFRPPPNRSWSFGLSTSFANFWLSYFRNGCTFAF